VKCWGKNSKGQLGQGDKVNYGTGAEHMAQLAAIQLGECDAPTEPLPQWPGDPMFMPIFGTAGVLLLLSFLHFANKQRVDLQSAGKLASPQTVTMELS